MKVYLYCHEDHNPDMATEWEKFFKNEENVIIKTGDICKAKVDAIVSPANSYGFMNGGLDAYLTLRFGEELSENLQQSINFKYGRELLIGEAILEATGDKFCPNVICAPTMIVPMDISNTINVFLSTRASLEVAREYDLESIAFSAMGTGVGKVPKPMCARQMYFAYREFIDGWEQPNYLCEATESYKRKIWWL